MREYKTLAFKAGNTDGLADDEFCGYLAALNNIDEGGDVILPGAFIATIPDFLQRAAVCWQHDLATPIGKWLEAREDSFGLFVRGRISQTSAGKDALVLLRDGVIATMSIGYEVLGYRMLADDEGVAMFGQSAYDAAMRNLPWYQDQIRALTALKLWEGSIVTIPMNPRAVITGVKEAGARAGLPHDAHYAAVHAAVEEYLIRVKGLAELRRKAGRMLSATNAERLQTMRTGLAAHVQTLDELLAANTPADDPDDDDTADKAADQAAAIRHELLRFARLQATTLQGDH